MRTYTLCLLLALSTGSITVHAIDINKSLPRVNFLTVSEPNCVDPESHLPALISDPRADIYYRAAKKIAGQQDGNYFTHMFTLGKKAADLGHWRAKLFMAELYMTTSYNRLNPKQARIYLDELMEQDIPGAFYLMSQYRQRGGDDFDNAPSPASAYLYESARRGDPRGMVDVANIFRNVKRYQSAEKLIQCGIKYGHGIAAQDRSMSISINSGMNKESWKEAFRYNYLSAVAGDSDGLHGFSSLDRHYQILFGESFAAPNKEYAKRSDKLWIMTRPGFHHDDPDRKRRGLPFRVKGNTSYKLPNLDKVLPFPPPAKLPAWNGDFSVLLSAEDAKEYRTDYHYDRLVKEILIDGLL
ncbi:sel1 repeat family protein [Budviciaceae bacterium BWR-B9]|uniref:Sel1 repeat family protein n=1 Tax=Limnobaculum allomyrinae TaxID=2791986 RepID=A0ABS1IMU9_9GAMM|nr:MULTISPECIES: hypothetical protein [Limnobaculum]MBK5142999.1 sel1 repeat family protein [Limnobaculum allomyrinae]MBV7693329.1 hypothetical protein [Limnobaculum sp. M2-1]